MCLSTHRCVCTYGNERPVADAKSSRLVPFDEIDYNLRSPLNADGSNYPCRGYQNDRPIRTTATYTAGQSYTMGVTDTTTHGGGSCQLSLSYDNGATFRVIKSITGGCPLIMSYNFTIPAYAPSGNALFAWTWFNEIWNREMYMNCAQVEIQGSSTARRAAQKRGGQFTSMDDLPFTWRANIDGLSTCVTRGRRSCLPESRARCALSTWYVQNLGSLYL